MGGHVKISGWTTLAVVATALIVDAFHRYYVDKKDNSTKGITKPNSNQHSEELVREQLARNYAFLGEKGMEAVRKEYVIVVGVGGVGSNCATALVRSGISQVRLIDFDQVSLSSLNRHSCATLKDVGTSKVDCLKKFLLKIAPWCEIDAINELFNINHAKRLLLEGGKPDYVVDCIDNLDTKVDLLEFCYNNGIKVISSMGAACKSDATRVNIGDISTSDEDPLSRSVRRRLKKRGISNGITCIFSAEKPDPRKAQLLPLPEDEFAKGKVDELSALQNFRVRILPVLGTMPAIFGLAIATYLITEVGGYPTESIEGKNRYKVYDGILQTLSAQQSRIGGKDQRVQIALSDVQYILEEVFRGKSPISGYSTRLTLSRWNPSKEISIQNVVIMTKDEQKKHEDRVLNGGEKLEDVYPKEVLDTVEQRFEEERYYAKFR